MKFHLILASILALSGCAGTKTFTGPTGETINTTKCKYDESQCFIDASDTCKGPYQVIASSRSTGGLLADAIPGPVTWYKMTYSCGKSDGTIPQFQSDGRQLIIPQFQPVITVIPPTQIPQQIRCTTIGNTTNCAKW
jgi:hypothetical protein